ncbi:response regulator [candidate division WWE3 bacterium CG08_land_8_20_14_0_20_40_13]|uniref:Response regulator n=1 Tax=candidate division WWE3 bacterium CG08_land_8_20_14_0_20_40_13 TaxID=1975084 RepID=A0A2H0XH23_UNCKA|nr:MAG: response regulator [candidate division WWE3 bacterium CG08_land_8_20_14_0_20_40_13]
MGPKYKILLVEDKESLRTVYAEYLRMEGFVVDEAKDGQEALDKAMAQKYDLVLLDVMLPKVDGLEVLKSLKSNPQTKDTKVYMLTVLGRDTVIKEGFDIGADGYLIKDKITPPMIKEEILQALSPKAS